ncbi:MAG: DUF3575 domain-containing protein [Bacteroidales bacterium]|nr:DUF3575 domain-containing protein [Bacteroidales bacterium]
MKKIHFITFIIIALISMRAGAQTNKTDFMIKYDFISLLGDQVTNSMGIQLGAEIPLNSSQSVAMDAMYIFPCQSCDQPYTSIYTEKTSGWMLSAEYRHYIIPGKQSLSGFHLGPQILFQHTKSEMRETYGGGIENHYQVYRDLLAAHVMAGYQLRITGPLYFNPALGLGARFISSRNENKKGTDSGQHEYPYDKDFESGSKWFPGIHINIKLGLKL